MHSGLYLPKPSAQLLPPYLNPDACGVFNIFTSKCASRHNGVHFFNISTSKSALTPSVFTLLTSKCASRHNGVHFFDVATSTSAPKLRCFGHFDFEMCFAPQRRALFRQRNFQKWSEPGVLCTFWLRNVLRATTACAFSTAQLLKCSGAEVFCAFWLGNVLRAATACTFSSLIWPAGSAPAALASLISTLQSHKSLERHIESRLFYLLPHLHLLSSHSFSSLIFSFLLFSYLNLPTSAFPSVHIVGSLTAKLPSITQESWTHLINHNSSTYFVWCLRLPQGAGRRRNSRQRSRSKRRWNWLLDSWWFLAWNSNGAGWIWKTCRQPHRSEEKISEKIWYDTHGNKMDETQTWQQSTNSKWCCGSFLRWF